MQSANISDYSRSEICKAKNDVLRYLKRGKVVAVAAGMLRDARTNEIVKGDYLCLSDESYVWTTKLIYHFEKYDCVLPTDFLQHILGKLRTKD